MDYKPYTTCGCERMKFVFQVEAPRRFGTMHNTETVSLVYWVPWQQWMTWTWPGSTTALRIIGCQRSTRQLFYCAYVQLSKEKKRRVWPAGEDDGGGFHGDGTCARRLDFRTNEEKARKRLFTSPPPVETRHNTCIYLFIDARLITPL